MLRRRATVPSSCGFCGFCRATKVCGGRQSVPCRVWLENSFIVYDPSLSDFSDSLLLLVFSHFLRLQVLLVVHGL